MSLSPSLVSIQSGTYSTNGPALDRQGPVKIVPDYLAD